MRYAFSMATLFVVVLLTSAISRADESSLPDISLKHALSLIQLPAHEGKRPIVQKLQLSTEGRLVATRDSDWRVLIWDAASGTMVSTINQSDDRVDSMVFSPDGELLLTAAPVTSDFIRCWSVANGRLAGEIPHTGELLQFVDRETAQAVGAHERIRFRIPAGPVVDTVGLRGIHNAMPLRLSSDDRYLLIHVSEERGIEGQLELYDLRRFERIAVDVLEHDPTAAVVGRDGEFVAAAHRQGTIIHAWLTPPAGNTVYLAGHRDVVQAMELTPDELFLISGGADGALRVWDLITHRSVAMVLLDDAQINSLVVSADGRRLAAGIVSDRGPDLAVWDVTTFLRAHGESTTSSYPNAYDALAALGTDDGFSALLYLLEHHDQALPILDEKLRRQLTPLDQATVRQLVAELDHADFPVRDRAYRILLGHRFQIRNQLREAAQQRTSVATKLSLRRLLENEALPSIEQLPQLYEMYRTVYLLERYSSERARSLLALLRSGHTDKRIRDRANGALTRLQLATPTATATDNS